MNDGAHDVALRMRKRRRRRKRSNEMLVLVMVVEVSVLRGRVENGRKLRLEVKCSVHSSITACFIRSFGGV